MRLWDTIREKTLTSNAPACVYEEGDLIKRAIRDLYNKDVQDVMVEGEEGYRNAKDFMRMLMPSHARNVHQYKDTVPLFQRLHIEAAARRDVLAHRHAEIGRLYRHQPDRGAGLDRRQFRAAPPANIPSRKPRARPIWKPPTKSAASCACATWPGLIVIDFIDMEDGRNDREVEKRLRDAVKNDRARVQIGKISQFGLLEMSRQRLRAGVVAGSTVTCPHCGGAGIVRSVESTALRVLRALEEEGEKNRASAVTIKVANDVAIYALNQKRRELARIEAEYGMDISFEPKEGLMAGHFELERTRVRDPEDRPRNHAVSIEAGFVPSNEPEDEIVPEEEDEEIEEIRGERRSQKQRNRRTLRRLGKAKAERRRRRRGGRGRNRDRGPRPEGLQSGSGASGKPSAR